MSARGSSTLGTLTPSREEDTEVAKKSEQQPLKPQPARRESGGPRRVRSQTCPPERDTTSMIPMSTSSSPAAVRMEITPPAPSPMPDLPFAFLDLSVVPGEVQGGLVSGYREYKVSAVVRVADGDTTRELRTRRVLRYSAARELFYARLVSESTRLGLHLSFQSLFDSFPPKQVTGACSDVTAKLRARAMQTYLLSVVDVAARLVRIARTLHEKNEVRRMIHAVLSEFLE